MMSLKKVSGTILLIADILLMLIVIALAFVVGMEGKEVGQAEVLEIKENGEGTWYENGEKLRKDYVPTDAAYELVIKDFIRGLRMIESYYDSNEYLVRRALMCSVGNANDLLQASLLENNPFELSGSKRIDVPYNSITVEKISQTQWKASWRERTYDSTGKKTMEADYEAVFHTKLVTSTGSRREYNPLGIVVYEYDIDLLRKLM